jgi:hypothetical protein
MTAPNHDGTARLSLSELIALHEASTDDAHRRAVAKLVARAREMEESRSQGRAPDPRGEIALRVLLRLLLPLGDELRTEGHASAPDEHGGEAGL